MASYRKPITTNNKNKRKTVTRSPVRIFMILAVPLLLIAAASLYLAITMPSGAAESTTNANLASIYGATEVKSTDQNLIVTIDGTVHKCFKMPEEELKAGAAIQCDNGVLLNKK